MEFTSREQLASTWGQRGRRSPFNSAFERVSRREATLSRGTTSISTFIPISLGYERHCEKNEEGNKD